MKKFLYLMLLVCSSGSLNAQSLHHLNKDLPCIDKTYQVYVHVMWNEERMTNITADIIKEEIEGASMYFDPICVRFEVCKIDTFPDWNYDDYRTHPEYMSEIVSMIHEKNRINIYYISEFDDPNICGLARLKGIAMENSGVVYIKKACGSGTVAHELGHLFGLKHTFEGSGKELVDGSNCLTEGDGICDTPADPYVPFEPMTLYLEECEFISLKTDDYGDFYQPDVGNVMSYYPCACGFTRGQYLKMAQNYLNSNFKMW